MPYTGNDAATCAAVKADADLCSSGESNPANFYMETAYDGFILGCDSPFTSIVFLLVRSCSWARTRIESHLLFAVYAAQPHHATKPNIAYSHAAIISATRRP